jgi:hypothetical protein
MNKRSPAGAQRNPGAAEKSVTVTPDFASLRPGFQPRRAKPSRLLPVIIDRQHLAADRLPRVGGEEHRERRDVRWLDHRFDRLRHAAPPSRGCDAHPQSSMFRGHCPIVG